jgi:hypothetical protein
VPAASEALTGHGMATLAGMAYDAELADRIRFLIGTGPGITEKKMFGGLAFLVGGNMAISASGQGGVLVRVDPPEAATLIARANATEAVMGGRTMQGSAQAAAARVWAAGRCSCIRCRPGFATAGLAPAPLAGCGGGDLAMPRPRGGARGQLSPTCDGNADSLRRFTVPGLPGPDRLAAGQPAPTGPPPAHTDTRASHGSAEAGSPRR